jgi:hypothetical protein
MPSGYDNRKGGHGQDVAVETNERGASIASPELPLIAIIELADNNPILPLRRNCEFLNRLAISFLLGLRIDHAQVLALLFENVD